MSDERVLMVDEIADEFGKIRPIFASNGDSIEYPNGSYAGKDSSGRKVMDITYVNGVVAGPYKDFWSNGSIATEGQFQDGLQEGTWRYYSKDGQVTDIIEFHHGKETRS